MDGTSVANAIISLGVHPDSKMSSDLKAIMENMNSIILGGMKRLERAVTVARLSVFAKVAQDFSGEIEKIGIAADRLNMPVEQMDAWTGAANMAGVSTEGLISAMNTLHDSMVSAARFEGGGLLKEMMRGYMPQVGDMDAVEDYMLAVADAVKGISKVEAHRELTKIGLGDPKLQRWLMQGSEAIKRQIELSKKLGVISEEDRLTADKLNFAMRSLQRTFERILLPVFRVLAPVMENLALALLYLREHWMIFAPAVALGAAKIAAQLLKMAASLIFFNPILTLTVGALAALGVAFEDLMVWLQGGNHLWGAFWESIFGSPEMFQQMVKEISNAWDLLTNPEMTNYGYKDFFKAVGNWLEYYFGDVIDQIINYLQNIDFKGIFSNITTEIGSLLNGISWRGTFEGPIGDFLSTLMDKAKEFGARVPGWLEQIGEWIAQIDWSALFAKIVSKLIEAVALGIAYIVDLITSIDWLNVLSKLSDAFSWIAEGFLEFFKEIEWANIFKSLLALFLSIGKLVIDAVGAVLGFVIKRLVDSVVGVLKWVWDVAKGFFDRIASFLPSFKDIFSKENTEKAKDALPAEVRGLAGYADKTVVQNDNSLTINVGSVDSNERVKQIEEAAVKTYGRGRALANSYTGSQAQGG